MKNFKYSILRDFNLVIRQSDGPAIKGGCVPAFWDKKRDGALFAVQACPDRAAGERHGYKFY